MRRRFVQTGPNNLGRGNRVRRRHRRIHRRGGVTVWTLVALPAILALFCFVVEMTHLWHAKVKLKNAAEAGVLAAAKNWGDSGGGGTTGTAAMDGEDYAEANSIDGLSVTDIDTTDFVFGSVTPNAGNTSYIFTAGATMSSTLAVRIDTSVTVSSFCQNVIGVNVANYDVSASAAAIYDTTTTPPRARLVWLSP